MVACKGHVPAAADIIVESNDVEWRAVGRSSAIVVVLPPVDQLHGLGDFMRNLAVGPLVLHQKFQRGTGGGEVTDGVECERGPHGIAAEVPTESRPMTTAGDVVSSDQALAGERLVHQALNGTDARPVVSELQA